MAGGIVKPKRIGIGEIVMLRADYVVALGQDGSEVWITNCPTDGWSMAWKVKSRDLKLIPNSEHGGTVRAIGWGIN